MACTTLTIELLYSFLEREEKYTPQLNQQLNLLKEAATDWPTEVFSVEHYAEELRSFIGKEADKKSLEDTNTRLDYNRHAWQAESIASILDLYKFYRSDVTLSYIIQDIKSKL